ncbi:MAG: type II secretion system minor pseudopilin GspI [Proteobacteria bacterium]|nr:type II secretion system minor pseudopilin GspI [Pseudomonadota bacterium]
MSAPARGFTLIEVLVALAIVALGMAAVMGALSSSADTASYLRERTFAQWVGLNQIATLRLSGNPPPTGTSTGDADLAGRSWHWSQEVTATDVPGMVRIEVSVRPAEFKGDDKSGWVATVNGSWGSAINHQPNMTTASFPDQVPGGGPPGNPGLPPVGAPTVAPAPNGLPTIGPGPAPAPGTSPDPLAGPGPVGGT